MNKKEKLKKLVNSYKDQSQDIEKLKHEVKKLKNRKEDIERDQEIREADNLLSQI